LKIQLALTVGISLAIGSFVYQVFADQDWHIAIEHAWFQLTSCFAVGLADWWVNRRDDKG